MVLLICGGILGILIGRFFLKRWFNHLSIYSAIWTISLGLYYARLIYYNSIIPEAWFFIILAWVVFYLGSLTVLFAVIRSKRNYAVYKGNIERANFNYGSDTSILGRVIIVMSLLSCFAITYNLIRVVNALGGLHLFFANLHLVYKLRLENALPQGIPYLSYLALGSCSLAGVYTARRGKLTIIGIFPLFLVLVQSITGMGRAAILIALVLFVTSFLFSPHPRLSLKMFVSLLLTISLIVGGFVFIGAKRGLVTKFEYESPLMGTLRRYIPSFPSWYAYISGPPVVFSEYLKAGGERSFPGSKTFAPFFNVLSHFGIVEHSTYEKFYCIPICSINTGTYLRDIYSEFSYWGILIFPYLMGFICTMLYIKVMKKPKILYISVLSHLYVIVVMSFDVNAMKLGYWWISMLASIAGAYFVSSCVSKNKLNVNNANGEYTSS